MCECIPSNSELLVLMSHGKLKMNKHSTFIERPTLQFSFSSEKSSDNNFSEDLLLRSELSPFVLGDN